MTSPDKLNNINKANQALRLDISYLGEALSNKAINRWHLDSPKQNVFDVDNKGCMQVRGWILCEQETVLQVIIRTVNSTQYFKLSEARPDVIRKILQQDPTRHPCLICGFNFKIDDWNYGFDIGFLINNEPVWAYNIRKSKTIKVEEGARNWLFLGNDTNSSVEQYTGHYLLTTQEIEQWKTYFQQLESDSIKIGFNWAFLLAPAKEFIFPEYYPFKKGEMTPVDQLISSHFSYGKLVWPYDVLSEDRELTYWKGDTHWTDYGGAVAAQETLKTLGFKNYELDLSIQYSIKHRAGDLGGKFSPPRISPVPTADFTSVFEKQIFDNQVHNHGRIRVYENGELEHTKTCCILFGDSFSVNVTPWLVKHFYRLIYIHTAAAFDRSILKAEQPTHVILQTNSRFIINPPKINFSIRPSIEGKLKKLNENETRELINFLHSQNTSKAETYKQLMLEILNDLPHKNINKSKS